MEAAQNLAAPKQREIDVDDLLNDPDLEKLHSERLAQLQREVEKRQVMQRQGHGEYQVRMPLGMATTTPLCCSLCSEYLPAGTL
jgi:hypothetical protein